MTNAQVIIRDIDPVPVDNNTVIKPFNFYGGRSSSSLLSIDLPVRAIDYANAITTRQASASSEFNVDLRSSPRMGVKVRLD